MWLNRNRRNILLRRRPDFGPIQVNWRRGMFRVWLLLSAAWLMGWVTYLIIEKLERGFGTRDPLLLPVLLFGPPIALPIFGVTARWVFRQGHEWNRTAIV